MCLFVNHRSTIQQESLLILNLNTPFISPSPHHLLTSHTSAWSTMADQHARSGSSTSSSSASSDSVNEISRSESRPQGFAESIKSRLRSTSNPNAQAPHLDRVHSAKHLDDQSVYHSDHTTTSDEESLGAEKVETIQEVRNGIVNERDVDLEKGPQESPEIQKSKSARSTRSRQDAKLVCTTFSCGSRFRLQEQQNTNATNSSRWIGTAPTTPRILRTGRTRRSGPQPSRSRSSPSFHPSPRRWWRPPCLRLRLNLTLRTRWYLS